MATEIVIFPLRAAIPNSIDIATAPGVKDLFDVLTEENGFQRAYWGREIENPNTFRLFVDWDSPDAHTEFTKKEYDHSRFLNAYPTNPHVAITNHS